MSKDKNHNTISFIERDIDFINSIDGIKLSGTLSIPNSDTKHPCVILISGSGAHTRDQVVLGHKIFRDIAHYLSNNGIAVFRFDDRGVGKSEGLFKTAGLTDFRNDIISAFHHLQKEPNIDKNKIGVLGHSLGGLIAPMVENQLMGQLAFLISLAGTGMIGYELYIKQHELIAQVRGTTSSELQKRTEINRKICDLILQTEDKKKLMQQIRKISLAAYGKKSFFRKCFETIKLNIIFLLYKQIMEIYTHPWFRDFLLTNPKDYWTSVQCPVLAINGGKDLQVPAENLDIIESYVKEGGGNIETKLFPDMNHLFQSAQKGLPEEYAKIKSSISNDVLDYITNWIKKVVS
jgi:Dipeptidyl aminopeptidases/acylaminoacyl-peptidases